MNTVRGCLAILTVILCVRPGMWAQVVGAGLSGTVTEATGAVIVGGRVKVVNTSTGVERVVTTNSSGFYAEENLLPGEYRVSVAAAGFQSETQEVALTVGAQQVVNFRLTVGAETQVVQVIGRNDSIELASSELGATVGERTVRDLPLNGRSWTDLATLQPGVSAITAVASYTGGSGRGNRGFGSQLTISGARPQQNNYRLDGISINDYSNGGPGSVTGGNLGVEAVQEFSVLTGNYSAEYGKTSGGVINAITRQGTNQLHGTAYEFLRNSVLDARNYFDPVGSKPSFRRNQFGAAVGGPIIKNRTFLFGNYEGVRQATFVSTLVVVPSVNARQGILVNGTGTKQVPVDPNSKRYLGFYPSPNGAVTGDTAQYNYQAKQIANEDFATVRGDHTLSNKDNLFGTYKYDRSSFSTPDNLNSVLVQNATTSHTGVLEESHTFSPELFNTFRIGVNRAVANNNATNIAINSLAADTTLGALPGQDAAQLSVPGIAAFGGGLGGAAAYFFHFTSIQGYDDAFVTRGRHSIKAGIAFERLYSNILAITNGNGIFTFNTLSDFITNQPRQFQIGFASSLSPRDLRQNIIGGYVQDDWRALPNLTVNLGMRYEMATVPTESHGKLSALRSPTDTAPHLGDPYFSNPTYRNLEPRIGFNLDTFGKGTTVLSGGAGIFDVLPLTYEFNLLSSLTAPFFGSAVVNNPPQGSLPTGAAGLAGGTTSSAQAYIEPNPHRNYIIQYNLRLQQAITPTLIASASFLGSRGIHQPFRSDDINIVLPTLVNGTYHWPGSTGVVMNPAFGDIRGLFWRGDSYYDGLEVQVKKSLSHGFQMQGSFTFSKNIDTSSSTLVGNAFANSINSPLWIDLPLNRALSDFDVRRLLAINGFWSSPHLKLASTVLDHAANGYEIGGIFKASDGIPFTALMAGDPLGLKSTSTFAFPNRISSPDCASLVNPRRQTGYIKTQCFTAPNPLTILGTERRNSLIGPGLGTLDVFLVKNTPVASISEAFNVQLRAEAFNITNHSNFAAPLNNKNVFDAKGAPIATAGLIDTTVTNSRQLQLAIKFIW